MEISPPKGVEVEALCGSLGILQGQVDAVNITDSQGAILKMGSLGFSKVLLDKGFEPIFQLTCRDRNRIALQQDLLSGWVLGVRNVLAVTGDHPSLGDHPQAKPVFDLDSVQLLGLINSLNKGKDFSGHPLKGKTDFFMGAVVNPNIEPQKIELLRMEKKIKQGAQFFQTQLIFDTKKYLSFYKSAKEFGTPIIVGIFLLRSYRSALYMRDRIPGVYIPQEIIERLKRSKSAYEEGLRVAQEIFEEVRPHSQGVHYMCFEDFESFFKVFKR